MVTDAGHQGMDWINDTNPHTPPNGGTYDCFIAMTAAVANIVVPAQPVGFGQNGGQVRGFPDLTAVNLAVGVPFRGLFSGIKLASGTIMAFYGA